MCRIIVLLITAVLLPSQSKAANFSLSVEVTILKNVVFLSKEELKIRCEENPELERCNIIIADNENEKIFDVQEELAYVNLQRNQYPVRMIDFE